MNRRSAAVTGALALTLVTSPVAAHAAAPNRSTPSVTAASPAPDPAATALKDLRADAEGSVVVHRDGDGDVASVSSADGGALVDSGASTPRAAATKLLSHYGAAFGIDGTRSTAQVTQTIASATGGTVVRTQQVVDGVPVFGGQVVLSLDKDQDVSSVTSATTDPDTSVPAAVVSQAAARATALSATARAHHVAASTLTVTDVGRRLYDPSVVGETSPYGPQPVWQFAVSNGYDVRQTVLVGTGRGSVLLTFNDAPGLTRRICDNQEHRTVDDTAPVPTSCTAARIENGAAATGSGAADINAAYDNMGHVSDAYAALDDIDLTDTIGLTLGSKTLLGTVRWCYTTANDEQCPYDNAFWDGNQMVFGQGYAGALDVVGHEMTHGYVAHTSQLYTFHQSGAINESVADTIGEIVDHRNGGAGDSWDLGEDVPATPDHSGPLRNMADPTQFDQPDSTQSPNYDPGDVNDDNGAVHQNDGIGNKTAYLISQGDPSFGGQNITGIDVGDTGDTKTGLLYLEMIKRLTSGADWAQYGQALESTCDSLVSAGTGGFTSADCVSVDKAVTATQLETPIASAAPQVTSACPTGSTRILRSQDDESTQTLGFVGGSLWHRTPAAGTPTWASSGASSWFAWDPIPSIDHTDNSALVSAPFAVPTGQPTYVHFDQAYVLAWDDTEDFYEDGGRALVQVQRGSSWVNTTVPVINGANRSFRDSSTKVFGGDSMGYGSSRIDLSSLGGQTVRLAFVINGDSGQFGVGWWLDDLQLYSCPNSVAAAPTTSAAVASASAARISWGTPSYVGSDPVTGYRVTSSTGRTWTAGPTARSLSLGGLNPNATISLHVAAVSAGGNGAASTAVISATTSVLGSSAAKVKKNKVFRLTATVVRRGSSSRVASVPVVLQKKVGSTWRAVASGTTGSAGTKVWSVKQKKATYYRVVTSARGTTWGSASGARKVAKKK